jgi:ketosteroid isomerase-like protein
MKHTVTYVVVTLVLGSMFISPARADTPVEMLAAAMALDQRFVAAVNAGDVDEVMATYWNSPELVTFWPDAMIARGWNAAKEGVARMLKNMPGATFALTESHQMIAGDTVIGWGLWRLTVPRPDGGADTIDGRYTDVMAKRDGQWVYILDHASAPLPPAAGSPVKKHQE